MDKSDALHEIRSSEVYKNNHRIIKNILEFLSSQIVAINYVIL